MSLATVKTYLSQFNKDSEIRELDISTATVELAADAIGTRPERIAKTISMRKKGEEGCILIVAAGDAKIDNLKFKSKFGKRGSMLSGDDVERLTGHAVGGVCPFANPDDVKVYVDISIKRFDTVFPACGSSNSLVELTTDELYTFSNALDWIDVCAGWQKD